MIPISNLSMAGQQQIQITDQQKAIFTLRSILNKACRSSFTFDKNNTGLIINQDYSYLQKKVEVRIENKSDGDFTVTLRIRDYDNKTNHNFESNIYNVDVAIKHKSQNLKPIVGNFVRLMSPDYGATVTLKLQNEGEYEILIGNKAKIS